jgi:hypothetical protein
MFISVIALFVAYIATKSYTTIGSLQILLLGCSALAFGIGSLLRVWLEGRGLNIPITIHDSAALVASVLHLLGASLGMAKLHLYEPEFSRRTRIVIFCYIGIFTSIALITFLSFQGVFPPLYVPGRALLH